ncbi:MAG: hypothetical protein IPL61_08275 [Myxococcales bacterium]|nr:hypothetical protein [Myxococcales bacterium]
MSLTIERGLAGAAVIAAVAVGGPLGIGALFAIATVARLLDGRGWASAADRDARAAVTGGGAIVGAAALGLALLASAPVGDALRRGVEWSTLPVVRGSIARAATLALVIVAVAVAAELALRRWLLELVATALAGVGVASGVATACGIAAAAVVEAAVMPFAGARAGIAVTGVGLGILYVGAGRRIGARARLRGWCSRSARWPCRRCGSWVDRPRAHHAPATSVEQRVQERQVARARGEHGLEPRARRRRESPQSLRR